MAALQHFTLHYFGVSLQPRRGPVMWYKRGESSPRLGNATPTYAFHTLVVSNNTMFAKSAESGAATLHVWDVSKEAKPLRRYSRFEDRGLLYRSKASSLKGQLGS